MAKKKYPSFKIDFLGCNIVVILDKEWLKICGNILDKDLADEERFINSNAIAFAKDQSYYIAAPPKVKDATLNHECFHILMEITEDFDLGLSHDNHELQAYLIEYLIEKTMEIKKKKLK